MGITGLHGKVKIMASTPRILGTPTKSARPPDVRTGEHRLSSAPGTTQQVVTSQRRCIVCCVPLVTTKYFCVDFEGNRRGKTRQNLASRLSTYLGVEGLVRNAFERGLAYGSGHLYVCESCMNSVASWEKAEMKRNNNCTKYFATKPHERPNEVVCTPKSTRQKRLATETPEKPVKRLSTRLVFSDEPQATTVTQAEAATSDAALPDQISAALSPAMSRLKVADEVQSDLSNVEV